MRHDRQRGQVMAMVVNISRAIIARYVALREWRLLFLTFFAILLAGCSGTSNMGSLLSDSPQEQQAEPLAPNAQGGRKVALLLPLSGNGTASVAVALKQAAELALGDAGNSGITLQGHGGTCRRRQGGSRGSARGRCGTDSRAASVERGRGRLARGKSRRN
jgi:hypothetical protein